MDEKSLVSSPNILQIAWSSIASVGWYAVGAMLVLAYSWPYIHEKYTSWRSKSDQQKYDEKYHKDPDIALATMSKIELARQRMQEKYNQDLEIARQKAEALKEKKRQEALNKIAESENGHRLGGDENSSNNSSTSKSKSKLLKDDYNPLMGDSGRRYRPPKRSCCGSSTSGCG